MTTGPDFMRQARLARHLRQLAKLDSSYAQEETEEPRQSRSTLTTADGGTSPVMFGYGISQFQFKTHRFKYYNPFKSYQTKTTSRKSGPLVTRNQLSHRTGGRILNLGSADATDNDLVCGLRVVFDAEVQRGKHNDEASGTQAPRRLPDQNGQ
jgi:hypothetical protein